MNETHQNLQPVHKDNEIDLPELLRVLWAGKWIIGSITLGAIVITVIVTLILPNVYRAEALLAPNDQDSAGGLSSLAAQYGGLASLAGISLSAGGSDNTALGIEILQSRKFISDFVARHKLLVPLVAADGWDAESGEVLIDPDDYDVTSKKWIRSIRPPKKTIPSLQEAYEEFMDILAVSQDKKTGFVTVSVDHYSPVVARDWVSWLINDLNTTIMRQDVAEAEQAIEYLNTQIENTSLAALQNVFFSLIEEQTKTVMLASVSKEYVFKTIDPAFVPEEKLKPQRSLIVLASTFLAAILSLLLVILMGTGKQSRNSTV